MDTLPTTSITKPPAIAPKQKRATKISRQLRAAIDAMVWLGLKRDDAAERAGMKDNSLYVALRRPDVKAAYLAECEVLRVSGRARRIHRLEQMSEQDENKAAVVNAIRALELMGADEATAAGRTSLPGLQIVIVQGSNPVVRAVDDERGVEISTTYTTNSAHGP